MSAAADAAWIRPADPSGTSVVIRCFFFSLHSPSRWIRFKIFPEESSPGAVAPPGGSCI